VILGLVQDFQKSLGAMPQQSPKREMLASLLQTIRLSQGVLMRDPLQLPSQLHGRLAESSSPWVHDFLRRAAGRGWWLRPYVRCLTPPGGPLRWSLAGHTKAVHSVAMAARASLGVSGSDDGTIRVWNLRTAEPLRVLGPGRHRLGSVAIDPDGRYLVSGFGNGEILLWEPESGAVVRSFHGHTSSVTGMAIAEHTGALITSSRDKTARLWTMENSEADRVLTGHTSGVMSVAITPDGKRAITGGALGDLTLRVWDLDSGAEIQALKGHRLDIVSCAISADGNLAASVAGNEIKVWDLEAGCEVRSLNKDFSSNSSIVLSSDARLAITAGNKKKIRVWDVGSGELRCEFSGHAECINALALGDDDTLLSGASDATLRVWDLRLAETTSDTNGVHTLVVSPDGLRAVSVTHGTEAPKLWDIRQGKAVLSLKSGLGGISCAAITPDSRYAVTGGYRKALAVWSLESKRLVRVLRGHTGAIRFLSFTPDSRFMVSAGHGSKADPDLSLKVWHMETGRLTACLEGLSATTTCMDMSKDGRWLVAGSSDGTVALWDLANHTLVRKWFCAPNVMAVVIAPNNEYVVTGALGRWDLWSVSDGKRVRGAKGLHGKVCMIVVDPGGSWFATASTGYRGISYVDDALRLWKMNTGEPLSLLKGHEGWINSMCLSHDARRIVTASQDRSVRVWDVVRRVEIVSFWLEATAQCCSLTPNGRQIIVGDALGRVCFLALEGGPHHI